MENRAKKTLCLRGLRVPEREEVRNGLSLSLWEGGVEDGMMSLPTRSTISSMISLHIITTIIFSLLTKNSLKNLFLLKVKIWFISLSVVTTHLAEQSVGIYSTLVETKLCRYNEHIIGHFLSFPHPQSE